MFELISGYGVWHRRYFVLEGYSMYYWNHPNDKETKVPVQTRRQTESVTPACQSEFFFFGFLCFNLPGSRGQHFSLQLPQAVCQTCQEGLMRPTVHLRARERQLTAAARRQPGCLVQVRLHIGWNRPADMLICSSNSAYRMHDLFWVVGVMTLIPTFFLWAWLSVRPVRGQIMWSFLWPLLSLPENKLKKRPHAPYTRTFRRSLTLLLQTLKWWTAEGALTYSSRVTSIVIRAVLKADIEPHQSFKAQHPWAWV